MIYRRRKATRTTQFPLGYASSSSKMPRRKRTNTTTTSSTARIPNPQFVGGEPTAPTKKEWEEMTPYQRFVVRDSTGTEYRFPVLTYGLILPEGADPNNSLRLRDYWVGKIKEIRSRNSDPSDVWVNTQWLMSADDVLAYKQLNTNCFGKLERALSNHFDFVHTSCFADLAQVVPYVESDAEPAFINDETFYYRHTFDIFSREMKPMPSATCLCDDPYNPDESPIMHFCPRKGCRKAYHATCLRQRGFTENPRRDTRVLEEQRALQFERSVSDSDEEDSETPNFSSRRNRSQTTSQVLEDRHREIPGDLLALARSPMVKGQGTDLPFEWSCVAGNFGVVTRARKLVREVVEDGKRLQRKWCSLLEIPDEEGDEIPSAAIKIWVVKDELFLCPGCKGAI